MTEATKRKKEKNTLYMGKEKKERRVLQAWVTLESHTEIST